jgi:TonB-linked SusC/RagA family outer membrane protein
VEHTSRDQRLYASFSASYSYDKTTLPTSDILTSLFYLPPDYPLHTASGGIYWDPAGTYTNPLDSLLRTTVGQTTNLITNGSLHYRIWKGLTAKANLGYTASGLYQNGQRPKTSYNPTSTTLANAYFADNKVQNYVVEPQLEYSTVIGKGKLQVLAGGTIQQTTAKGYEIYGSGYTNDALLNNFLGAGTLTPYYNNSTTYKYNALFGRINYNLAEKYLLNINFRRDGSSRFGSNHHYGNFGSAGAAWIFTQESFVKGAIPFLSYEKLRASYGITGNDQITNYQYLSTYGSSSTYAYQSTAVYYPSGVPNPDLQWETNKKLEVAVELGFLKDRILLTTAYYRNRSGNLLIYLALPSQVGFSTYLGNFPAVVQNSGLEVELNTKNIKSKDFEWTTSFNFSLPKNQVTSFPGLATSSYANTYVIGQPVNLIKVYSYTGTKSTDGTLSVSSDYNNRLVTSVGTPYNGGMNNNITYKSLQLSFFFQYNHQMGRTMYQYGPTPIGGMYNQYTAVLNRWQKAGDNALFPKATTSSSTSVGANTYYFLNSNAFWGDASFIKLKTVSLSYSLPAALIKKIKMSTCSFYIQGQNLFTWSKQKYVLDPETSLPGTGGGLGTGVMNVPPLRTIVAGIRCSL